MFQFFLLLHTACGVVALLTFWTAALAKKGSTIHLRAGRVYLLSMVGILLTGVPLIIGLAMKGQVMFPVFLSYLLIITGTACWNAWNAIKSKRDRLQFADRRFRALAWLNLLSGIGVLIFGLNINNGIVLIAFSFVGIFGGISALRFAKSLKADPRWWLRQHIGAMIGNGIATHIAFLSIGLPRLFPGGNSPLLQNIAWLGPLVVASVAFLWLRRRYLAAGTRTVERVG